MSNWKTFTEDELKSIRSNPYVKSATSKMIRFTVAFKEEFWRRYDVECQPPRKIIEDLGLNPDMLGSKRIDGITYHLKKQVESGEGFHDIRRTSNRITNADMEAPPSRAIMKMQHKIAYMEQELEYIKKTIKADNAARRKKR